MLRLVTWWKNFHRKVCLLPLIASCNYNPRVICANDVSNYSCTLYSREICRMWETVNPSKGFTKKKKLWASNSRQWDHELIRRNAAYEKTKLISGNSLVLIYSSAGKVSPGNKYWSGYIKSFHFRSFSLEFRLHQFSKTNFWLWHVCVIHQRKKKATKEIEILPTVKFSSHIPISMLS